MPICNSLSANFDAPCIVGPGGVEDRVYLVQKKDINQAALAVARDPVNKLKLGGLPLNPNAKIYYLDGKRGLGTEPSSTFSEVGVFTQELHSINLTIYNADVATKWQIENMKGGRFVVVYRNNDGEFEVLGLDQGLSLTAKTYTPTVAETRRTTKITLANNATQQEPYAPATLLITDAPTTVAYLEANLFVPA